MEEIEYILDDAAWQNQKDARHFLVPTKEEIQSLRIGDSVRMTFIPKDDTFGCPADKMWVKITEIADDHYLGELQNQPQYLRRTDFGETVEFKKENISEVFFKGEVKVDLHHYAIITKKALENKEINCAAKTDEKVAEQDSGWQLFYGDESEEYLSDSDNITIICLDDVLAFEPQLDRVFNSEGEYFEYSRKQKEFVAY